MTITADAVVIGGGINGCTSAYSLKKRGVERVLLIEKGHIASGPTGLSSGVVRQHYSHATLSAMARDSVAVWRNFDERIGGSAGFVQCGVVFFSGPRDAQPVRTAVEMHRRMGIDERIMSADELREIEPRLYTGDIAVGAYDAGGGYADPALAAAGFAAAAEREGVEIVRGTEVTGFRIHGGRLRSVLTTAGEISTDCCVNVAGPWGGRVAALAGVSLPIKASRHPVVVTRRAPRWAGPTVVWGDLVNGWYFKPDGVTHMLIGSIHDIEGEADIENHLTVPTIEEVEAYVSAIVKRFPVMEEGSVHGGWAALYDVTPDWHPIIAAIPEVAGFYCAVGFSGHGFKIGPAVGTIVSELVTEGRCSS
ncbi:MAG TPA: FAD-dependent oxidoreductase, partial [Candidatus Baltobacteraceae bacterium]|nr:FAD-dependent oxidoreductase [Candidatus Baltobacteraceae bacterium]